MNRAAPQTDTPSRGSDAAHSRTGHLPLGPPPRRPSVPMRSLAVLACVVAVASGWDVARTPPLGWNSWNYWNCGVNATVLMETAKAMVSTGLSKVRHF